MSSPKVMALSEDEAQWLTTRLFTAQDSGLLSSAQALAESFDASRDDWRALPDHERGDSSMLLTIYSVAFGERICREFDLQWCVVERGADAEIALYDEDQELLLYPLATVRRRWEDPAMRPMMDLIEQTRDSLTKGSQR
ncbi:DUF3806 domain-containing protein [Corynebacterium sp.]|uniref:DUF3806 domain-containing protein n=1 Tax=Corynebacterium sp. TaxID=1720 RepID=UPI0037368DFE